MPSALENLVAVLKREQDLGALDTAVAGGLGAYAQDWQNQARQQARRARHQILIDEIVDTLTEYAGITDKDERINRLDYLLDRVTNRLPPPPRYKDRLPGWEAKMKSVPRPKRRAPASHKPARQQKRSPGRRRASYDGESWDDDYLGGPSDSRLDLPPPPRLERPPRLPRQARDKAELAAVQQKLAAPTTDIAGIGKKFGEMLAQRGLHTIRDLLYSFPRAYHDYTRQQCIKDIAPGGSATTIIATVQQVRAVSSGGRNDLVMVVGDGSGRLTARLFGQGYNIARLRSGMPVVLHGKVTFFRDTKRMTNPQWEELDLNNLTMVGIVPVYRMTKGLRPRLFRRAMQTLTKEWADKLPDPLPSALLDRCDLADLGWAVRQRHFPEGEDHREHARRRLIFDELLMLQLALLGARREWQSQPSLPMEAADAFLNSFIAQAFPYELTQDQARAVADIRSDLRQPLPMNRLLQGDVGSGKTAVAIVGLAVALHNKAQAAIMAPTGILAEQHYKTISETFATLDWEKPPQIALLTGALTASERESIYQGLADGEIDIVIGTHALIQAGLAFKNLALAIIDEQHRFGVDQRATLRGKGRNPHLLVMSATPFPRSLALTLYADLDLSVISEKPPGRQPVQTEIIEPVARERLHGFIESQLEQGRQAFFVHPLVEESAAVETASATEAYERLSQVFYRHRVALLHGRMSAAEKDQLMTGFAARKYDVLVTTTVAEVGVDVPNASVIVIDGANRFGLAQLHQFRGRVGRGASQSYCFLLPDSSPEINLERIRAAQDGTVSEAELSPAERRLAAMEQTTDGFELAELDMQLRGSGSLPGKFQSGANILQHSQAITPELIKLAQTEAQTLFAEDPALELPQHKQLAAVLHARFPTLGDIS
ncbi:MAG: ATP-dependent DNA helicase RecG [Chloroflexi bacterium]|nr:ATP-dependent DNA helicase RecG [Chloroflexota bacterium]MCY4246523.1 ATP-dependent DNA helicase RecG [Chloroflexota bacterium]